MNVYIQSLSLVWIQTYLWSVYILISVKKRFADTPSGKEGEKKAKKLAGRGKAVIDLTRYVIFSMKFQGMNAS